MNGFSSVPSDGDIVITRHASDQRGAYLVGSPIHPAQIRFRNYQLAFGTATTWARQSGVAVWFTDDGVTFRKIDTIIGNS